MQIGSSTIFPRLHKCVLIYDIKQRLLNSCSCSMWVGYPLRSQAHGFKNLELTNCLTLDWNRPAIRFSMDMCFFKVNLNAFRQTMDSASTPNPLYCFTVFHQTHLAYFFHPSDSHCTHYYCPDSALTLSQSPLFWLWNNYMTAEIYLTQCLSWGVGTGEKWLQINMIANPSALFSLSKILNYRKTFWFFSPHSIYPNCHILFMSKWINSSVNANSFVPLMQQCL